MSISCELGIFSLCLPKFTKWCLYSREKQYKFFRKNMRGCKFEGKGIFSPEKKPTLVPEVEKCKNLSRGFGVVHIHYKRFHFKTRTLKY